MTVSINYLVNGTTPPLNASEITDPIGLQLAPIAAKLETIPRQHEVTTFTENNVPADYTQVSGPLFTSDMLGIMSTFGFNVAINDTVPANTSKIVSNSTKLFAVFQYTATSAAGIQELNANFAKVGSLVTVPLFYSTSGAPNLVKLATGDFLKIGATASAVSGTNVNRYNVSSSSWTTLASKPTAVSANTVKAVCSKHDSNVYLFDETTTRVDRYNVSANTWTEGLATCPISNTNLVSLAELPSGNIYLVYTTAQYVFNVTNLAFTLVASDSVPVTSSAAVSTSTGARVYLTASTVNNVSNCIVFRDYTEATNSTSLFTTNVRRPASPESTTGSLVYATNNPLNSAVILKCSGTTGEVVYQHHMTYTPHNLVQAAKN